jgi:hypothetical protein
LLWVRLWKQLTLYVGCDKQWWKAQIRDVDGGPTLSSENYFQTLEHLYFFTIEEVQATKILA